MFQIHSITGRMFIGISSGFAVGILAMLLSPSFGFSVLSAFGVGTLITFVLMGLTIGLIGMFDYHPILGFKMRWWIRGSVAAFLFALMYILLGYDTIATIIHSNLVAWTGLTSPFWVLCDGITIGLIVAWLETKIAGEGSHLPLK